jgi:hypothetical protein
MRRAAVFANDGAGVEAVRTRASLTDHVASE